MLGNPGTDIVTFSEEESIELGSSMLDEWLIVAWQEIIGAIGTSQTQVLSWKYMHTGGISGGLNLKQWGLLEPDGFERMARALEYPARFSGSQLDRIGLYSHEARLWLSKCIAKRIVVGPSLCETLCNPLLNGICKGFDDRFAVEIPLTIARGDAKCCWRIVEKGYEITEFDEAEKPIEIIPLRQISNEEKVVFSLGYRAEGWIIMTRTLMDPDGSPESIIKLINSMGRLGRDMGGELATIICPQETNAIRKMERVLVGCSQAIHQKRKALVANHNTEMEITECPFSSAPPEICAQVEAFWNGVTQAIDPSYVFAYDRMMTKGHKTCHWTIRKKVKPEKALEQVPPQNPVNTLTMRFARGEITEDELESKIAHLRKLGLLK
jgi:hypothetical protein